jgi:hypothetical protein
VDIPKLKHFFRHPVVAVGLTRVATANSLEDNLVHLVAVVDLVMQRLAMVVLVLVVHRQPNVVVRTTWATQVLVEVLPLTSVMEKLGQENQDKVLLS